MSGIPAIAIFLFVSNGLQAVAQDAHIGTRNEYDRWNAESDQGFFFVLDPSAAQPQQDNTAAAPQPQPKTPTFHIKRPDINLFDVLLEQTQLEQAGVPPKQATLTQLHVQPQQQPDQPDEGIPVGQPVIQSDEVPLAEVITPLEAVPVETRSDDSNQPELNSLLVDEALSVLPDAIMDKWGLHATNCPNAQRKPCLNALQANRRVLDCCKAVGVHWTCWRFCNFNNGPLQVLMRNRQDLNCPAEQFNEVRRCLAGGQNLIPCCLEEGVHPACVSQCNPGSQPPPPALNAQQQLACRPFPHSLIGINKCFLGVQGQEAFPYNPDEQQPQASEPQPQLQPQTSDETEIVEIEVPNNELQDNEDLAALVARINAGELQDEQPAIAELVTKAPKRKRKKATEEPTLYVGHDGLADKCPNDLDIPCISEAAADDRMLQCCHAVGLHPECFKYCNMQIDIFKLQRMSNDKNCPIEYQPLIRQCLLRDVDTTPCCQRAGVPSACVPMCAGEAPQLTQHQLLKFCAPIVKTIESVGKCVYLAQAP